MIKIRTIINQKDVLTPLERSFISHIINVNIEIIKPKQKPLTNKPTYCNNVLIKPNRMAIEQDILINCISLIVGCVERII